MEEEQIKKIQEGLDSGEIDPRNLDEEQRVSLQELIARGVITTPPGGLTRLEADRSFAEQGILGQAETAARLKGIKTPAGTILSERSSFELVGDVIGSFLPYLANKRNIIKDIREGVKTTDSAGNVVQQMYTKPTGKNALRLERFDKASSKLADVASRVVGRRAGVVGKVFKRTASFLDRTASRGGQLIRAEKQALERGDPNLSMLRPGARTEASSLVGGAVGASIGSAAYDLTNFTKNLTANLTMDVGELTEDGINENPFPVRLLQHSFIAARNSLGYGLLGTSAGYFVGGMIGRGKKSLLGLNNPESVALAKKAVEQGVPLSPTALASQGFGGFLSRNFFKIFGVTPFVGGPGAEKLRKTVSDVVFPDFINSSSALAPSTSAVAVVSEAGLGAEGLSLMARNYQMNREIIETQYKSLLNQSQGLNHPPIIDTTNFRAVLNQIINDKKGIDASQFKAFATQQGVEKAPGFLRKSLEELSILDDAKQFFTSDQLSVYDAAMFKRFMVDMLADKTYIKNQDLQIQGRKLLAAFDMDMAAAENFTKFDLDNAAHKRFVDSFTGSPEEKMSQAVGAAKKLAQSMRQKNDIYYKMISDGKTKLDKLKQEAVLANAMNDTSATNSQDAFKVIFKDALSQQNPQAIREFKRLIGVNSGEVGPYANKFMDKLGTRFVFDAFNNAFRKKDPAVAGSIEFDPGVVLKEDVTKAENVVRKLLEKNPEYKKFFPMKDPYDTTETFVDQTLFNNLDKFKAADRKMIENALSTSSAKIKIDPDAIDNFSIRQFRDNLGIDTANGRAVLNEIFGKEQAKRIEDLTEILTRSVDIGITDPSAFLLRRYTLGGGAIGGLAGLGGFGMFGIAGGIVGAIIPAIAARYYGKWIADPNTTKAALDLYTKEERRTLLSGEVGTGRLGGLKKFPFTGKQFAKDANGKFILDENGNKIEEFRGIFDPTKPLGDYMGPGRARNLAIFLNSVDDETKDEPRFDAQKITMQDVQQFLEDAPDTINIPNAEVSPFQLPEETLKKMYPDVYAFKQLSVEDKNVYVNTLKAALQAEQQDEEFNKEVQKMPEQQADQDVMASANQAPPVTPAQAAAPQNKKGFASRYSFLFPQDPSGQAIAQQQEIGRG